MYKRQDYDSEFRYDAKPLPSLQSIDDHGRVIYLGTFSKSIAPSLRIGYMVLPPSLLPLYQAQYAQFSCAVSRFEQQVLDAFLRQGAFETHLNRMRKLYKEKRKTLVSALEAAFPHSLQYQGEQAGHHVLVHLPGMPDGGALCRTAMAAGVKVYPLSPYFIGPVPPAYQGHVPVSYTHLVIHGVFQRNGPAAIQHIAENLQKMLGAGAEDDLLGPAAHPAGLCQVPVSYTHLWRRRLRISPALPRA